MEGCNRKVVEEGIAADKEDRTVGGTEVVASDTEAVGHNIGSGANGTDTCSIYSGLVAVHLAAGHSSVVCSHLVVVVH